MSEIVISGIAGRFPQSDNVEELKENLLKKIYMVGDPENRIKFRFSKVASSHGLMRNIEKFDSEAFNLPKIAIDVMDPQCRILNEHVYEAIIDAGVSPKSLLGSNTGVFAGCFNYDSWENWMCFDDLRYGAASIFNSGYTLSNQISYIFGFRGPSISIDTACSSSMYCLNLAYKDLKNGVIDAAVVIGTSMILNPHLTKDLSRGQALTLEGISKPFDKTASGYVRSEASCVLFLQRADVAKRVYATVLNSVTCNDGAKSLGLSHPSVEVQALLLKKCYDELNMKADDVDYLEAHATSTDIGDYVELNSIDDFIRDQRKTPLKIGAIKSNIGHSEGASGVVSIVKSILMFENGKLFPNINIEKLRDDCPGLTEGRIEVVREVGDFDGKIIGVNNFGIIGTNAHCVLKRNEKVKENGGFPKDNLPRLLLWSGRTNEGLNLIFDNILAKPFDDEYFALLQHSQSESFKGFNVKGFAIFKFNDDHRSVSCFDKRITTLEKSNLPVVFVYAGMGSQWLEMGRDLIKIPMIAESIQKCHDVLAKYKVNLKDIISSNNPKHFDSCINIFVSIVSIQIALTDLLCSIGIKPDFYIGHSLGELCCSYIDKTLTLEQTVLAAYFRGVAIIEGVKTSGNMAAIAMNHEELEKILPNDIEIACYNSVESCTISGPVKSIEKFVKEMKAQHVLAKIVDTCGVAYHSSMIAECGPILADKLKDVIKEPKKRSSKWITTSEVDENDECSSIQYHVNNMIGKVHFAEGMKKLPENAVMIEIAPHGLLQPILKQSVPNGITESLTKRDTQDGVIYLLQALGKIFQSGVDMNIREIYPKIDFPVSRSTSMISQIIKWNHQENRHVPIYNPLHRCDKRKIKVEVQNPLYSSIKGHQIDDRIVFPATGYLFFAAANYAMMNGIEVENFPVFIEDISFFKATFLHESISSDFYLSIDRGTNTFDLMDESESICRGKIRMADDNDFLIKNIGIIPSTAKDNLLMKEDFYKELRVRGYQYKDDFALVEKVQCFSNLPYRYGEIEWKGNFLCFVDAVGQAFFTNKDSRELMLPTFLRRVTINNIKHNQMLNDLTNCRKVVDDEGGEKIFFDLLIDEVNHAFRCGGVEIVGIESQILNRRKTAEPVLETYEFIPNFPTPIMSMKNVAKFCIQVLYDATTSMKHKFVELEDGEEENSIMKFLVEASNDTILSNPEFHLFTNNKIDELKQIKINELDEFSRIENVDFLVTSKWKNEYFEKINDLGMLLLRNSNDEVLELHKSLKNVACIQMENEKLLLFKKAETSKFNGDIFEVPETQESFEWIENLKKILETCDNIIIYSKSEMSGILGFFKTLKKEYSDKMIKCFIIEDDLAPMFDPKNSFYADQLDMGLSINIYKNGKWGSFKHLDFNQEIEKKPQSNHAFVHLLKSGLTSSISWVNGDLDVNDENNIDIHYSALNFRDILVANSRISLEHSYSSRKCAQYKIGLEFSGKTKDGRRVAGLHESKCISNSVKKLMVEDKDLCFNVPDNISLEDAATVPVVYLTVYVAFFIKANIKSGQSILIHSGSGGVGLAAIQTAFAYGLEVFTTCGSEEKREFLLKEFPQLKNENIGNSRNTSFEQMIMKQTKGVGVDYVMNSLVEDKMHASLRCLAKYGTFFEIGKFDILMRNKIDLSNYLRDIKYIVIDISEDYFYADDKTVLRKLFNQIEDDIKKGWVKPIIRKVFDANDVQKAFKYMTTGKHVGKILLKIRENEDDKVTLPIQVRPYVFFDPEKSYVLVGGLGGMGMEIADWMIMRNCKKLVFSSSRGISNSFQSYRLRIWQTYEVDVVVNTSDVTTKEGCTELLEEANRLGQVGGIFNLAAILSDAKFSEQTIKSFEKSYKPKALSTKYLDEVSRVLCPYLDHFVFFSSASAGRGMGSQTNYSLSNSVGEKIILNRHESGFPAKAIQFGPIRDVGLLSRINKDISSLAGFIFQSMNSCFEVLDKILLTDEPIFSSIIIASQFTTGKSFREVHKIILESIGVTDESTIGEDKTLSELGVDSLSGYEIQQGIQRETGVIMTLKEIRSKTYWELKKECEELAKKKNRY